VSGVSDAQGLVSWSGLRAGEYRYRIQSPTTARPTPPNEARVIEWQEKGGRAIPGSPNPLVSRDLSGSIFVRAGEATRIDVEVPLPGLLAGRIVDDLGAPAVGASVVLALREAHTHPLEPKHVWVDVRERAALTDGEGYFELPELRSGTLQLTACFELERGGLQNFFFVTAKIELGLGESRDLGTLAPHPASTAVEVAFETSAGESLDFGTAYAGAEEAPSELSIDVHSVYPGDDLRGYEAYLPYLLWQKIAVDPRQPFVLHGLGWSRYALMLDLGGLPRLPAPLALERATLTEFPLAGGAERLRIPIRLRATDAEIRVLCRPLAAKGYRPQVRGLLVPLSGSIEARDVVSLDFTLAEGSCEARASVPAGAYRALVTQPDHLPSGRNQPAVAVGDGAYGEAELDVLDLPNQSFRVELSPAVRIEGILLDAQGVALAKSVSFSPAELARLAPRGIWLHPCMRRTDGSFSVGGVPVGAVLVDDRSGATHIVPGGGLSGIVIRERP
jgi:hypothetical protein